MMEKNDRILMSHGNGGIYMQNLITDLFLRAFQNGHLQSQSDSAILGVNAGHIAYTTDSFVVDPLFFPGGDIGSLSVCGTLNDLAVSGAKPLYFSAGFIIEEGFKISQLTRIVNSMARVARNAGVKIVTGDTKVVGKGKCDKLFINTSGIGVLEERHLAIGSGRDVKPGDKIIISGPPGEHGMAIMQARKVFAFKTSLKSDCANLHPMIRNMLKTSCNVHFMRDATRGGFATVFNELARKCDIGIEIDETQIPFNSEVNVMCELLGFDPLYIANEGKLVAVVDSGDAEKVVGAMRLSATGTASAIIGEISSDHPGRTVMTTRSGGRRILDDLLGDHLPRIC